MRCMLGVTDKVFRTSTARRRRSDGIERAMTAGGEDCCCICMVLWDKIEDCVGTADVC